MRSVKTILVGLCALGLLLPAAAKAQCPFDPANLTVITCGGSDSGDNTGGVDNFANYTGCNETAPGEEEYWHLTVAELSDVTVTLTPASAGDPDLVVAIIPYDCDLDGCYATGDGWGTDVASATLAPGDYIIVADGYNSGEVGSYTIDVACQANACVDADGDGYYAYDAVDCPDGDDCCDVGDEGGPGCDAAHAAQINTGAAEVCGDGIDNDCEGTDETCVQLCTNPITITCNQTVAGDSSGGVNNITNYSCLGYTESGLEAYYLLDLQADFTVTATVTPNPSFDAAIAILPETSGVCAPGVCIAGEDNGNPESATANLTAGTYYIVVDGYGGAAGTFDLEVLCQNCVDGDNDGHSAIDPVNCPSGDDCNDGDPNINPGMNETCGDATDSDCDGYECDELCISGAPIACGDVDVAGSVGGAGSTPNFFASYSCLAGPVNRPEYSYTFTPAEDSPLTIVLTPVGDWDPALMLIEDTGTGCDPAACIEASDTGYDGDAETITTTATAGTTYYVVVDGWGSGADDYSISVVCGEICEDLDGDGFNAFDAADCPSGDDCCDAGDEGGTGCDANSAVDINPGALEICGDAIDQDCDGEAQTCPTCGSDEAIDCVNNNSGTIDPNVAGAANIDDYCNGLGAANGVDWSGPEYIFDFSFATDTGIIFETTDNDFFLMQDFGNGVCNPDGCLSVAGVNFQSGPSADALALANATYYLSVDGLNGVSASFDWTLTCFPDEACTNAAGQLECDSVFTGTTTGETNNVTIYDGSWPMPAPDLTYTLQIAYDATVTLTMTMPNGADLALLVVGDDGNGACLPRNLIAFSDEWQQVGDEPEIVTFQAAAGMDYYVIVDGWVPDEFGAFQIVAQSTIDCGALTQCGCDCTDTQADVNHCGDCATACSYANAAPICNAGTCEMGACIANFGDCNTDPADGCEVDHLTNPNYCGNCATVCSGATPFCVAGVCTDNCPGGQQNCGGVCVDTQTDLAHCGGCDQACDLANTDAMACVAGNCEIVTCTDGYDDCDADHTNGCETTLGTDADCGSCGDACTFDNATGACTVGVCELTACDADFADCDDDWATGCETSLGTDANCSDCDDACTYVNGTGACNAGACELTSCDANYGDCDQDALTGCETMLNTSSDCGACGLACGPLEGCAGNDVDGYACTDTCLDGDADGFADAQCGGPDCDDSNAAVNPGADEACNDADDDCDGTIDEGFDADADGYKSCGAMADCNDADPDVNPGATEICQDGVDNDCAGGDAECACADADKDGYEAAACGGTDCNDADITINPAALEICDEIDNDCDGNIDEDGACDGGTSGCGCASAHSSPAAGGLLLLALVLGLALPRRRNS